MIVKCKVIDISDKYILCGTDEPLWWLGGRTFKLPKDDKLKDAKKDDIVDLELS